MDQTTLLSQNLHWLGQKLTQKIKTRSLFTRLIQEINFRPMIFLTGMRRTGKSTLIKQLLEYLLEKFSNQENIRQQFLFWEWNSQSKQAELEEILEFYLQEIADLKQIVYIFFDEIQFIENYENVLKLYFDRYENLRFVLTGSLSFSYKKTMKESLAGRFIEHRLYPLSFQEYLDFQDQNDLLRQFLEAKNTTDKYLKQGLVQNLNPEFRIFLKQGRFPDTLVYKENYQVVSYLESILNQSLNQDSIDYFQISKPREMNLLYRYLVKNNGGEISLEKIGQNLGISWQTINRYLEILELLGLIYPVLNTNNPLKQNLARKKIYTNSVFSLNFGETGSFLNLGPAVESYVLERFLEQKRSIFYFRQREKEVDLIDYQSKQAFEVKFQSKINSKDYENLLKISQKLGLNSILITQFHTFLNQENLKIDCLPACLV